jgi:lysophospholipid hydrolase
LGVIRALEEEGVPIDYIGGTSQGAFMGALYAKYLSADRMRDPLREYCDSFGVASLLSTATIPVLSYSEGTKFTHVVSKPFGRELQIEDLWLPFFCITTNMNLADYQVHTRGALWFFVRASMTILGYAPPMIDDFTGNMHIDGGYANNLPVDIMYSSPYRPKTIIAVDVEDKDLSGLQGIHNYGDGVGGPWLLWHRFNPFSTVRIPQFHEILLYLQVCDVAP